MASPASTPSQTLVLNALRKKRAPMSAYGLLEKLKDAGIKSPPIVYRALEALTRSGRVHRIQALNAYIACNCTSDHSHPISVLTVCQSCEKVEERHDPAMIQHVGKLSQFGITLAPEAVIELPITCESCAA